MNLTYTESRRTIVPNLGQRSFRLTVIMRTLKQTHTLSRPTAIPGPQSDWQTTKTKTAFFCSRACLRFQQSRRRLI